MAKDKKKEKKIVLERVYNIPLRKEFHKVPEYKRSKKAMRAIKEFLVKHMKSDKVKLTRFLNTKIWEHGIKNPPHHVKVIAKKDEEGNVIANLEGAPEEKKVEQVKKKAEKKEEEKPEAAKELEDKVEKAKEEKQEKAKEVEKQEIKQLKEEHPKEHAPKEESQPKEVEAKPTAPAGRDEMSKP